MRDIPDSGLAPALVIGGTGMLSGVVKELASEGRRTAVVARRRSRILSVGADTARPGAVLPVPVDYTDPERLHAALSRARQQVGLFEAAVLWIHTPSREAALPLITDVLADNALVVDVRGSAVADPTRSWPAVPRAMDTAQRRYQPVVLGFADSPAGTRWLTHEEISEGVLTALHAPDPSGACRIVGRVRPWQDRPG